MPNPNWEEEFDKLEWPMHLAGTGVDMEMVERDKQVKSFIRTLITQTKEDTVREVLSCLPERREKRWIIQKIEKCRQEGKTQHNTYLKRDAFNGCLDKFLSTLKSRGIIE